MTYKEEYSTSTAYALELSGFFHESVHRFGLESATDTGISQVQGEAQGSEDKINEFVQHLNKGPSAASVSKVDQSEISTKSDESSFNVQ